MNPEVAQSRWLNAGIAIRDKVVSWREELTRQGLDVHVEPSWAHYERKAHVWEEIFYSIAATNTALNVMWLIADQYTDIRAASALTGFILLGATSIMCTNAEHHTDQARRTSEADTFYI